MGQGVYSIWVTPLSVTVLETLNRKCNVIKMRKINLKELIHNYSFDTNVLKKVWSIRVRFSEDHGYHVQSGFWIRKRGLTLKVHAFLIANYAIYWGYRIWYESVDISNVYIKLSSNKKLWYQHMSLKWVICRFLSKETFNSPK